MGIYKDKKVLVTGGTGLIGRPLVTILIEIPTEGTKAQIEKYGRLK